MGVFLSFTLSNMPQLLRAERDKKVFRAFISQKCSRPRRRK